LNACSGCPLAGPNFGREVEQVLGRRPVATDRFQGRAAHVLMVFEPLLAQVDNADGLELQRAGQAGLQLGIDFGSALPGFEGARTDAGLPAPAMFKVGQVPDPAAQVDADAADAE
jgi:hypothetical protein